VGDTEVVFVMLRQDRSQVGTHLPLAWTRTGEQEEVKLMTVLGEMEKQFSQ